MALCWHHVDDDMNIHKKITGLYKGSLHINRGNHFSNYVLLHQSLSSNRHSQCYYGATNILDLELILASILQQEESLVIYIHYPGYHLNLEF